MKIFRRVPVPFVVAYLGGGLISEAIQQRKADKYANQVVRRYHPEESRPTVTSQPIEVTKEEAAEIEKQNREILLNGSIEELLSIQHPIIRKD